MQPGKNESDLCMLAAAGSILILIMATAFFLLYTYDTQNKNDASISALNSALEKTTNQLNILQANYNSLSQKLLQREAQLEKTQEELSGALQTLNSTKSELNKTKAALAQANSELNGTMQKIQNAKKEIESLGESVNSSMQWFSDNSRLPQNYSWGVDIFLERIGTDCIWEGELNLACINYLTDRTVVKLDYASDIEADHLQSIKQTLKKKTGDCEDYALFFKAILNSLKDSGKKEKIKAWAPVNANSEFRVWPKGDDTATYLYYPNAGKAILAELDSTYPYVICYSTSQTSGHCTIALSPNKINSSSQIYLIENSTVFEPQNGRFLGKIAQQFHICSTDENNCYMSSNNIVVIISDDDIYRISGSKWESYSDYLQKLSQIGAEMG